MGGSQTIRPSAREWLTRLRGGELSAYELASEYLVEVDRVSSELGAIVTCEPERVLSDARRADERRRDGEDLPLLGLPLTIKDALETAGLRSTGGSVVRADFVPDTDATVVARLRAAGAIVLAKTNLPEYSWSTETDNVVHGRTDNPLDRTRTCGGSSGGEAAALGADASPAGIGTDGGGSIRVPTHYCGTVGLRPNIRRHLAHKLAVVPAQHQVRLLIDLEIYAIGQQDLDGMRVTQRESRDLALDIGTVADADDIEFTNESGRNALHRIGGERAGQSVQRRVIVGVAHEVEPAILLYDLDAGGNRHSERALGSRDLQLLADLHLHAARQRDRFFSNSRHSLLHLPNPAQNFAADSSLCGRRGRSSLRGRWSGC